MEDIKIKAESFASFLTQKNTMDIMLIMRCSLIHSSLK